MNMYILIKIIIKTTIIIIILYPKSLILYYISTISIKNGHIAEDMDDFNVKMSVI